MRSVKPWLYLFSTDDPHSLVVNGTHSDVRTATAVVRPSPRSHAKQPSSAKVAILLIYLLTCIDTSVHFCSQPTKSGSGELFSMKLFVYTDG